MPYDEPFEVISRDNKTFVFKVKGLDKTIPFDRHKPAFILFEANICNRTSIQVQKTQQILAPQPLAQQPANDQLMQETDADKPQYRDDQLLLLKYFHCI